VAEQKADLCVRLNPHALPLFDEQGEAFSVTTALVELRRAGQATEWPARVHSGSQPILGRVCAIRKSRAAIERAHRRLREKQQNGKKRRRAFMAICRIRVGLHHPVQRHRYHPRGAGVLSPALAGGVDLQRPQIDCTVGTGGGSAFLSVSRSHCQTQAKSDEIEICRHFHTAMIRQCFAPFRVGCHRGSRKSGASSRVLRSSAG
jgi:hypothetical protein